MLGFMLYLGDGSEFLLGMGKEFLEGVTFGLLRKKGESGALSRYV